MYVNVIDSLCIVSVFVSALEPNLKHSNSVGITAAIMQNVCFVYRSAVKTNTHRGSESLFSRRVFRGVRELFFLTTLDFIVEKKSAALHYRLTQARLLNE